MARRLLVCSLATFASTALPTSSSDLGGIRTGNHRWREAIWGRGEWFQILQTEGAHSQAETEGSSSPGGNSGSPTGPDRVSDLGPSPPA